MQNKIMKYGFLIIIITLSILYIIINPENKEQNKIKGSEDSISSYKPKTEKFDFNTKLVLNDEEIKFNSNFEENFNDNKIIVQSINSLNKEELLSENIIVKYLGNHSYLMKGDKNSIKNIVKRNNLITSKFSPIITSKNNSMIKDRYIVEFISSNDKKEVFDSINNIVKNKDVFIINQSSPKNKLYSSIVSNLDKPLAFTPESGVNNFDILNKHGVSNLNYSDTNNLYNLTGKNTKILVVDGGSVRNDHIEFIRDNNTSKVQNITTAAIHYHPTHVSGTIVATGKLKESTGMAPDASVFADFFNTTNFYDRILKGKNTYGAYISNHSYGYDIENLTTSQLSSYLGIYNYDSKMADETIYSNPELIVVKSSGNDRLKSNIVSLRGSNGYQMITGEGLSKNIITINALNKDADVFNKTGTIANFGNTGPVSDGRIKPELSAVGVDIVSPYSESTNQYVYISGTSMAAPAITGMIALINEEYNNLNQNTPLTIDLVKALMINNSVDLGRTGPDYEYGFGMPNMLDTIDTLKTINDNDDSLIYRGTISDKEVLYLPVRITSAKELKLSINWVDVAANISNYTLVNDLDIEIVDLEDNVLSYPFSLNPNSPTSLATKTASNKIDNTEQIVVNLPKGDYILKIKGTNVIGNPAKFSVVSNHPIYRPMLKESYLGLILSEQYVIQMQSIIADLETALNKSKTDRNNLNESSLSDVQILLELFNSKKSQLNILLLEQQTYYSDNNLSNYPAAVDIFNSFSALINSYLTYLNTEINNLTTIIDSFNSDQNLSLTSLMSLLKTSLTNYSLFMDSKQNELDNLQQLILSDLNTLVSTHNTNKISYASKYKEIVSLKNSLVSSNILTDENLTLFNELTNLYNSFNSNENDYLVYLNSLITNIDIINSKLTLKANKSTELKDLINTAKSLNQNYIDLYNDTTGKYTSQINTLENDVIVDKISSLDVDLDKLNIKITSITSIIKEIQGLIDTYNQQVSLDSEIINLKSQIENILYNVIGFTQNSGNELETAYLTLIDSTINKDELKTSLTVLLSSLNELVSVYQATILELENSISAIITELSLDSNNEYVISFNNIKNNTDLTLLQDSEQLATLLLALENYKTELLNNKDLTLEQQALVKEITDLANLILERLKLLDPENEAIYIQMANLWLNDTSLSNQKILDTNLLTLKVQFESIISSLESEYNILTDKAKYNWQRLISYNNNLVYYKQFIESVQDEFYTSIINLIDKNLETIAFEVVAENNSLYLTQIDLTLTAIDKVKIKMTEIQAIQKLKSDIDYNKNKLIAYNAYLLNLINIDPDFKTEYADFYATSIAHIEQEESVLSQAVYSEEYLTTLLNQISLIYKDIVQGRIYLAELNQKKRMLALLEDYKDRLISYTNYLEYYMNQFSFSDYFPEFYSSTMTTIESYRASVDNYNRIEDIDTVKEKVGVLYNLIVDMRVKIVEVKEILYNEAKRVKTIDTFNLYNDRLKFYADYLSNLVIKLKSLDNSYTDFYSRVQINIDAAYIYHESNQLADNTSLEVAIEKMNEAKAEVLKTYELIKEGRVISSEISTKIRLINYYISLNKKLSYYASYLENLINNYYDIKERGYTDFWNKATDKISQDRNFVNSLIPINDIDILKARYSEITTTYLDSIKLKINEEYALIKEGRVIISNIASIVRQEKYLATYNARLTYYDQYLLDLVNKYETLDPSYSEYYNRVRSTVKNNENYLTTALSIDYVNESKSRYLAAYELIKEGRIIAYDINTVIRLQNYVQGLKEKLVYYSNYMMKYADLYSVNTKDSNFYNFITEFTQTDIDFANSVTIKDTKEGLNSDITTLKDRISKSYEYIVTVRSYR